MKILALTDHPLCTSGVGVQARMLIEGLLRTGRYTFRVLGGAMKHDNYDTVQVTPDFIIKPVDGFGTREQVRQILTTEQPDILFIFTDPRQFIWLWEVEDEIKQVCPIVYWHVWDNDPYPTVNNPWYESTELINCLSWKTYEMVKANHPAPGKVNYIPHAFPKSIYFPMPKAEVAMMKWQNFQDKSNWFKVLWVNRNAHRKMPSDLLESWKNFLDRLQAEEGHKEALLIMHTDPQDQEGPNLLAVADMLGVQQNVVFSTQRIGYEEMNALHNMADCSVSVSKAEGFGLSTLISMQCGKPIIALKTGGLTRQVVDWRDGSENGFAIEPAARSLIGSQMVPYIYEDIVDKKALTEAMFKMYQLGPFGREVLGNKCAAYVDFEFNYDKMISEWDRTLQETAKIWQTNKPKTWDMIQLGLEEKNLPKLASTKINQPKGSRKK